MSCDPMGSMPGMRARDRWKAERRASGGASGLRVERPATRLVFCAGSFFPFDSGQKFVRGLVQVSCQRSFRTSMNALILADTSVTGVLLPRRMAGR
jgi:hypothetical protein